MRTLCLSYLPNVPAEFNIDLVDSFDVNSFVQNVCRVLAVDKSHSFTWDTTVCPSSSHV